MDIEFIEDLCNLHVYPLVETGDLDPEVDNVEQVFARKFEFLSPVDWQNVQTIVKEWSSDHGTLCSVSEIQRRYGAEIAGKYNNQAMKINIQLPENSYSSRVLAYRSIRFLHIMSQFLPIEQTQTALEDLETEVRKLRKQDRERLKKQNCNFKKQTLELGIWFPHSRDMDMWRDDLLIGKKRFVEFAVLMDQVRRKLADINCLQHVPKRRLTIKSRLDMNRNMDCMRAFINADE